MIAGISSAYTAYQQAQIAQQVHASVLSKAIDVAQLEGQAVTDMMAVTDPGVPSIFRDPMMGRLVDILV